MDTAQHDTTTPEWIENITYDELTIGQSARLLRTLTLADIQAFAAVSGDTNPAHMNPAYAEETLFHGVIAHGMWGGALISALLGTQFPGPGTIYLEQVLHFTKPVRIGDTLAVTATVTGKDDAKKRVELDCQVVNQKGDRVLHGTARVLAAHLPFLSTIPSSVYGFASVAGLILLGKDMTPTAAILPTILSIAVGAAWPDRKGVHRFTATAEVPAPQPVVAEVQPDPVQPGVELCLTRRPARRLFPRPQHGVLGHVLGLGRIAQHPLRERQHARQLARHHGLDRRRVALTHATHQLLVGVGDQRQSGPLPLLPKGSPGS